ncbi:MAG: hypothetical protein LBE59_11090 [Nevskiaceae bacterium]|nr:hypothetical protein [Nevskiaceae bacterium]
MKHLNLILAFLVGLSSVAQAKDYEMQIGPEILADGNVNNGALWVIYGSARLAALQQRDKARKKSANDSGDDFTIELAGRQMMVAIMDESATGRETTEPYFQILKGIAAAGFLDEYVVAAFALPGWTIPATNIGAFDFSGFESWARDHPLGDRHPTPVLTVPKNGKAHPDIPGQELENPAQLPVAREACVNIRKQADQQWKVWQKQAKRLNGRAIAAENRAEFIQAIQWLARKNVPPDGATWVSPKPAVLAYTSGYCSVELGDLASALDKLRAAVELYPTSMTSRMELVTVLNQLQRFDESEQIIDESLGMTNNRCDLARIYRRRGYMRIDQGRLPEARADYVKSLEFEPGHQVALSELLVIDQELEKAGALKPGEAYKAPPPGESTAIAMICQ